uniref:Uncharacterized protein n=1 Tax=Arundo donax TaxID=35708 RepID=A0A0A8ZSI0_ARUDO
MSSFGKLIHCLFQVMNLSLISL